MTEFDISGLQEWALQQGLGMGLKLIGAVAMLIVGWLLAKALRRSLKRLFDRTELDVTLEAFLTNFLYWVFQVVWLLGVLQVVGIQITSVIALLGMGGFAVGLALQGTLQNFAAGLMILMFRPFKVGDYVEVAGVDGTVFEIGFATTGLNRGDNVRVLVPNGEVYGHILKNYGANDERRNDFVLGISYDDDIGTAIDAIRKVIAADPRAKSDPEPLVEVTELADSSVNLVVRVWCKRQDYGKLRWHLMRAFKEGLEAAGCSFPYPQRDVHVYKQEAS